MNSHLAFALAVLVTMAPTAARADLTAPGTADVRTTIRIEWGPLEGRLARPVPVREGDTWDVLAERETGDVRWAPTLRAMNGGAEALPKDAKTVWAPPTDEKLDAPRPWYSAYLDCAKFGRANDVSRTGLRRLDPAAKSLDVFGEVSVLVLPHGKPEDAARSFTIQRDPRASALFADPAAYGLFVAPSWTTVGSVKESAPLRRVEQVWRCEGLSEPGTAQSLRLTLVSEERLDGKGAPLRGDGTSAGLSTEWIAGLLAAVGLFLLARAFVRRWGRAPRRVASA